MLVNATLSCLCYGNGVNGQALVGEVPSSCGPAPTPYPVSMKFHSTLSFLLAHLPPSRNQLAERKRAEMRKRLHKVQLELRRKLKRLPKNLEARRANNLGHERNSGEIAHSTDQVERTNY